MRLKVEYLISIVSFFLGFLTLFLTLHFPKFNIGEEKVPGPAFFPNIIALLLIFVGLLELFEAKKSVKYVEVSIKNRKGFINIVVVIIAIFLYIILLNFLGFIVATFFFSVALMYLLRVGKLKSLIYSLIIVLILLFIFEKLFKIPLPGGIFNLYI